MVGGFKFSLCCSGPPVSTWLLVLLFNALIHAYNKHGIFLTSRMEDWGEKDSSLRLKTSREIVWMSETGAPGIEKGPLTSAGRNHITEWVFFAYMWECVRTSAEQIWDGIKMRGRLASISVTFEPLGSFVSKVKHYDRRKKSHMLGSVS